MLCVVKLISYHDWQFGFCSFFSFCLFFVLRFYFCKLCTTGFRSWMWRTMENTLTIQHTIDLYPCTTSTIYVHLRAQTIPNAHTEQAATRIQAVFRGHKVRASMKQGDSSANSNNTKTETTAINDAGPDPTEEELKAEFREDDKGK